MKGSKSESMPLPLNQINVYIHEVSSSFLGIEIVVEPFGYPNTLVEKVKLLTQKVIKKY